MTDLLAYADMELWEWSGKIDLRTTSQENREVLRAAGSLRSSSLP